MKEALEIELMEQLVNHDGDMHLSSACLPLHSKMRGERERNQVGSSQLISANWWRQQNSHMHTEVYTTVYTTD